MRLAFLTHEPFYPPSGGGSAEAVYLVREFRRRGWEVHLFGPPVAEPDRVGREFGIQLHPFTRWRMGRYTSFRSVKYLLYPAFLRRLVEAAARTTPFDLVVSQHAISAVAAGWLKRSLRVPVVMNFLDYLTGFMETWPLWLMPPPALAVLKRYELSVPRRFGADAVLTVSDTLADYFVQAGFGRERILPIYYGYDADLFRLDESAVAARTDAPPTCVMHGSLDHHHLRNIALEALAGVHQQRPDAVFKFVGQRTAALETLLRRARSRVPRARLECTGFVPYGEVARELASATVGLVPYEESSGTHCAFVAKMVEYLALGLPVVSTPLHGVRRFFSDEPLVRFSGFDGRSFSERILSWLGEPVERRRALAPAASERVRRALDWRVICRKAVDFAEQAAGRRAGAPSDA
jgi:glycosyltransferase involved in cell wall biosynthesis